MKCSLNEIAARLTEAALGAGLPRGVAEEVARAGRWLHLHGLGGCVAALEAVRDAPAWPRPPLRKDGQIICENAAAAVGGLAAADLLLADPGLTSAWLGNLDSPLLLAGLLGTATAGRSAAFSLEFPDGRLALVDGDGVSAHGPLPGRGASVTVRRAQTSPVRTKRVAYPDDGYAVGDPVWAELGSLASRARVPATETSRSGAGAGSIDND